MAWHPMSDSVRDLAARHGVSLRNQLTWRKQIYDGKGIALWWYNRNRKQVLPLSDHDIAHDIAHHVVAAPEQRDLPEYGLGNPFAVFGETFTVRVVDDEECEIQEYLAQRLTCLWGQRYGFQFLLSSEPGWEIRSWEEYGAYKNQLLIESGRLDQVEQRWQEVLPRV